MSAKEQFPILEVRGSYRDLGHAKGERFRDVIRETIERRKGEIPQYDTYLQETKKYFDATQQAFPHLIDELVALTRAAGVSVEDYFFINNREVFNTAADPDHCTIVASFTDHGVLVGHNEDWALSSMSQLFILKATINDTTILALDYAVTMPGSSAALNSHGLVQCINELEQVARVGVPKYFLARAVLECKTLDEAEALIRNTNRASGFNHVLAQDGEVRNIEISGDDIDIVRIHDHPYVHTNHFLSKHMRQYELSRSKSSLARYERATRIVKNDMTVQDMEQLLSDKGNAEFPICRPDNTVGSVILLPQAGEIYVAYGPPTPGSYTKYTL